MTTSRRRTKRSTRWPVAKHLLFGAWRLFLSFFYLMLSAMLILFGYITGWDADPGRPVIGSHMIIAGLAVFILGPRAIKRITGKDPIDPPPIQ